MKKTYQRSLRSIENNNVVAEEKMGYGSGLVPKYETRLSPDLTERIKRMSVLEVIG